MGKYVEETLYNILKSVKFLLNYFFLLWAHSPILSLTSDNSFTNLSFKIKEEKHKKLYCTSKDFRFSLITLYFGEYVFHIVTFNITFKEFRFIKVLKLSTLLQYEEDEKEIDDFKERIKDLKEEDISIEKEAILYSIERGNSRIEKSDMKLNIYFFILLAVFPFLNLDHFSISCLQPTFICICQILLLYFFINLCVLLIQNIIVRSYLYNDMEEIFEEKEKSKHQLLLLFGDYRLTSAKARLFVSFIQRFYDFTKIILFLGIIFLGYVFFSPIENKIEKTENLSQLVYLDSEKCFIPYTTDRTTLEKISISLNNQEYKKVIILYNDVNINEIKKYLSFYNKLEIEYLIDKDITNKKVKIIMEK